MESNSEFFLKFWTNEKRVHEKEEEFMDVGQQILKTDFTFQFLFLIVACIFKAKNRQ